MSEANPLYSLNPWPVASQYDSVIHQVSVWSAPLYGVFTFAASYWYTHHRRIRATILYGVQLVVLNKFISLDRDRSYRLAGSRLGVLTHNLSVMQQMIAQKQIAPTDSDCLATRLCTNMNDARRQELDDGLSSSGYLPVAEAAYYPVQASALRQLQRHVDEGDSAAAAEFAVTNPKISELMRERLEDLGKATELHTQALRNPYSTRYYRRVFGLLTAIGAAPLLRRMYRHWRWRRPNAHIHIWSRF